MKQRNYMKFDLYDLYTNYAHDNNIKLNSECLKEDFLAAIKQGLYNNENDILKFGKKTELAFYYVVKSLKSIKSIEQIDCGLYYFGDSEVIVPDYVIVLNDNKKILVEAKNNNVSILKEYSMNKDYYIGLSKYAKLHNLDLFIAIYWNKMRIWTLNNINIFENKNDKYCLDICNAMKQNDMHLLGDFIIGTLSPITVRIYPYDDYKIIENEIEFKIKSVEILCNNKVLIDKKEKSIAFYFYLYNSKWEEKQLLHFDDNKKLLYVDYSIEPIEKSGDGFDIVGSLSTMYTNQYSDIIFDNGQVLDFHINKDLGFKFDKSYSGEILKLWRFELVPEKFSNNKTKDA